MYKRQNKVLIALAIALGVMLVITLIFVRPKQPQKEPDPESIPEESSEHEESPEYSEYLYLPESHEQITEWSQYPESEYEYDVIPIESIPESGSAVRSYTTANTNRTSASRMPSPNPNKPSPPAASQPVTIKPKPQQSQPVTDKPPVSNISPPIVKPAESKAPVVTSTPPKVAEPPVVVTPPTPSPTTVIDFANEYRKQNGKSELSNNGAWSSFAAKLAGVAGQKGWACNSPLNVEIVVRASGSQQQIFEALKAAGGGRILSARYLGYGYSGGYAVLVVAGSSYTNAFNSADQKTAIESWLENGGEW